MELDRCAERLRQDGLFQGAPPMDEKLSLAFAFAAAFALVALRVVIGA